MTPTATLKKFKEMDIKSIGEHYGFQFSKVGDKWRALCLFHNDTSTPNLFIYPDDSFFCYACRRGGPKAMFVAYAEHVGRSAIDRLWQSDEPLDKSISINLADTPVNYKENIQLYISKLYYSKLKDMFPISVLREYDYFINTRKTITKKEYDCLVKDISRHVGGCHGRTNDRRPIQGEHRGA